MARMQWWSPSSRALLALSVAVALGCQNPASTGGSPRMVVHAGKVAQFQSQTDLAIVLDLGRVDSPLRRLMQKATVGPIASFKVMVTGPNIAGSIEQSISLIECSPEGGAVFEISNLPPGPVHVVVNALDANGQVVSYAVQDAEVTGGVTTQVTMQCQTDLGGLSIRFVCDGLPCGDGGATSSPSPIPSDFSSPSPIPSPPGPPDRLFTFVPLTNGTLFAQMKLKDNPDSQIFAVNQFGFVPPAPSLAGEPWMNRSHHPEWGMDMVVYGNRMYLGLNVPYNAPDSNPGKAIVGVRDITNPYSFVNLGDWEDSCDDIDPTAHNFMVVGNTGAIFESYANAPNRFDILRYDPSNNPNYTIQGNPRPAPGCPGLVTPLYRVNSSGGINHPIRMGYNSFRNKIWWTSNNGLLTVPAGTGTVNPTVLLANPVVPGFGAARWISAAAFGGGSNLVALTRENSSKLYLWNQATPSVAPVEVADFGGQGGEVKRGADGELYVSVYGTAPDATNAFGLISDGIAEPDVGFKIMRYQFTLAGSLQSSSTVISRDL